MLKLALTGGIASGKSTVVKWLLSKGIPVVDCDHLVHEAYKPEGRLWACVKEAFGDGILQANGEIDRVKLSQLVFSESRNLEILNAVTHPIVREMVREALIELETEGRLVAVVDIPLLFESRMTADYDSIMVVNVSEATQLERLMARNQFSLEEAKRRMATQMPLSEKVNQADYVIDNNGTTEALYNTLEVWYENLLKTIEKPEY